MVWPPIGDGLNRVTGRWSWSLPGLDLMTCLVGLVALVVLSISQVASLPGGSGPSGLPGGGPSPGVLMVRSGLSLVAAVNTARSQAPA